MAQIDDLVKQVSDEPLRRELEKAVKKLRKGREFGLVFEEHVPEVLAMPEMPLEVGGWALRKVDGQTSRTDSRPVQILSLDGDGAVVRVNGGGGCKRHYNRSKEQ